MLQQFPCEKELNKGHWINTGSGTTEQKKNVITRQCLVNIKTKGILTIINQSTWYPNQEKIRAMMKG